MAAPRTLRLGDGLTFPLDVVSRRTAILGQTDTGKTSTAVVVVEEAARCGAQFVVIDPTDAWYGLRSSADGEGPGVDCVVMGGDHGDVPLEEGAGKVVADLVADEGYNVVLSLKRLPSWSARLRFVADFFAQLYERAHSQILVVIDEAHRFAPQSARDSEGHAARCLGAVSDVVLLGRKQGLATVCVTQRPARLHKDVLEMSEIVIAHRLRGNNDRKALQGWIEEVDLDVKAIMAEVGGLAKGVARVSAPTLGINGTYIIRPKRTFDSSRSIGVGEAAIEPKGRAVVDLDALRERMAATIERAKADDPRALRRRIKELEAQLAEEHVVEVEHVEVAVPVMPDFVVPRVIDVLGLARVAAKQGNDVLTAIEELRADVENFQADEGAARSVPSTAKGVQATAAPTRPAGGDRSRASGSNGSRRAPSSLPAGGGNAVGPAGARAEAGSLSRSQQRILDALASLRAIGLAHPGRTQVALLAGVSPKSSGFEKNLSTLRTAGLIDYPAQGAVCATAQGEELGYAEAPATVEDLHVYVRRLIGESRWRVLAAVIDAYPDALPRETAAERAGVSPQSSGFEKNISTLRSFGLIGYPARGYVAALPVLFLEGAPA